MCNLYSQTKGQQVILLLTRALRDTIGNLPMQPRIHPDYSAQSSVTLSLRCMRTVA
jgi:hypothetical protein